MLKLHVFAIAPNGAKVRLYLAEKAHAGSKIELEEITVNLVEGQQKSLAFLAMNPFGKIPVLELDDGRVIYESLAIIEYLEELYPETSLWGPDPESRGYARQIERIADAQGLIAIAREIHSTNSPIGLPANPEVAKYHRQLWETGMGHLEEMLQDGRPYLAGERVTVGDCTLQGALQFARFADLDVLKNFPRLRSWCDRFRQRPTVEGVIFS